MNFKVLALGAQGLKERNVRSTEATNRGGREGDTRDSSMKQGVWFKWFKFQSPKLVLVVVGVQVRHRCARYR